MDIRMGEEGYVAAVMWKRQRVGVAMRESGKER